MKWVCAFVLAVCLPGISLADPVSIASIKLDMAPAAVQALLPQYAWVEEKSPYSGKILGISTAGPVPWAGEDWELKYYNPGYGAARLQLGLWTPLTPSQCRDKVKAFAAAAEPLVGYWSPSKNKPAKDIKIGKGSVLSEIRYPRVRGVLFWRATSDIEPDVVLSLDATADALPSQLPSGCGIEVLLERAVPPSEPQYVEASRLKLVRQLTIGQRHQSLASISEPFVATSFEFDCALERGVGRLSGCQIAGPTSDRTDLTEVARNRLDTFVYDMMGIDPDSPVPLRTRVSVTIDPADRKAPISPQDFQPTVGLKQVSKPRGESISPEYPSEAMRYEIEAVAQALCQIQLDGSLICTSVEVEPLNTINPEQFERVRPAFERSAMKLATQAIYQTRLPDGRSTEGLWVKQKVQFRLE
jgi:hypothetical protein